jgi:inward rectifier potassium channel
MLAPRMVGPSSSPPRPAHAPRDRERALGRIHTRGRRASPFDDLYHSILTAPWPAFALGVIALLTAGNALFAGLYLLDPSCIANARPGSFEDAFFFSVQTLATIGYGAMAPANRYGHVVVTVESFVGVLTTAVVTGLTFAKFARPTARIRFSARCVIGPRDGVPHLAFRLANFRHNAIVEASARVTLLVTEVSREGESLRRPYELPLVRAQNSLFRLSWVVMHAIDEASPFHGEGALERLRAKDAQLFVTVIGLDEALGQSVHAQAYYKLDAIAPNARFADVLTREPDGSVTIDYSHFDEVLPIGERT